MIAMFFNVLRLAIKTIFQVVFDAADYTVKFFAPGGRPSIGRISVAIFSVLIWLFLNGLRM